MLRSKTVQEFDSREFSTEHYVFSSFAYFIGAWQAITHAINIGLEDLSDNARVHPCNSLAVATEGWTLLLPESKKAEHLKDGEADELMFQAHMNVHA